MHITFFLFSERWNTVLKFDAKKALQLCWWAENFGLKNLSCKFCTSDPLYFVPVIYARGFGVSFR